MGTDVHLDVITLSHTEENGEEWWLEAVNGSGFFLAKDYDLFCKLGGVRCEKSREAESHWNRGFPKYAPPATVSIPAEAATWLRPNELIAIVRGHAEKHWGWQLLADTVEALASNLGEHRVRIVVSFDS